MNYFLKSIATFFLLISVVAFAEPPQYTQDKPVIMATPKNPEFVIKLKSNRTTGYIWLLREYDKNLITPIKHRYLSPISQLVGAPGFELWTFRVNAAGFTVPQLTYIRFVYARPWEAATDQSSLVEFKVTTQTTTSGSSTSHSQTLR